MTDPTSRRIARASAAAVSNRRRLLLAIELAGVALGIPLAVALTRDSMKLPILVMLLPVLAIVGFCAWTDRELRLRAELTRGIRRAEVASIALLFAFGALALIGFVLIIAPDRFLSLPADKPSTWLTIMIAYPILSALPQEIAFRTFFFHRYKPLLPAHPYLAVAMNGALFGFAHIIYGSAISVILTCILGALLAYRYLHTRSFWAVWLEHTLYGELAFTIGLGHWFLLNPPT